MRTDRTRRLPHPPYGPARRPSRAGAALVGALALLAIPLGQVGSMAVGAQERQAAGATLRDVVSKQITVGRDEAGLLLELEPGTDGAGSLEVRLQEGLVYVDGEEVGRYESGDALESAWRELLGRAVLLDDGPLARTLDTWSPPGDLSGNDLEIATRIDRTLERVLRAPPAAPTGGITAPPAGSLDAGERERLVVSLLGRTGRILELARALEGLDGLDRGDFSVSVGEDVVVGEDDRVDGSLLVIDGDIEVQGEVAGSVVVVGGTLRTFSGSVIEGDVRLADARLLRRGGEVLGEVVNAEASPTFDPGVDPDELRDRIRNEVRAELRSELRSELGSGVRGRGFLGTVLSPLASVGRGIAGLFGDLIRLVVLSLLGGVAVYFGRNKLEVVAETARRTPGRAAAVGFAGAFLAIPVWVLGAVALAVSIIGIPVVLAWLPLFPVAVLVAAGFGYFAVALNVGEWIAGRRYPYMEWIRGSNPYTLVVGGLIGLLSAFLLSDVIQILGFGFLDFLKGLLVAAGVAVSAIAVMTGFGAVLLTRAGRRPEFYRGDPFEDVFDWGWSSRPAAPDAADAPDAAPGAPGAPGSPGASGADPFEAEPPTGPAPDEGSDEEDGTSDDPEEGDGGDRPGGEGR